GLDGGETAEDLVVGLEHPGAKRRALEPQAEEGVGAAPADPPADLLEQRPSRRMTHDEHLPAGLRVHAALDEQAGQLFDSGVDHGARSLCMRIRILNLTYRGLDFLY